MESSPVLSYLCITTLKPCHWFISPEIKVTLTVYYPITFLPRSHSFQQLVNRTVVLYIHDATFQRVIICGSEVYLSPFFSVGSIALCTSVLFFSVSKCPPYLYCTYADDMNFYVVGFIVCFIHDGLFAHLPLQLPPLKPYRGDFFVMMM